MSRHAPRRCVCAVCQFSGLWGPRWILLASGKYACSNKCAKEDAVSGLLSGLVTYEDRPGQNGSREVLFADKKELEKWCKEKHIRLDWIRKKRGQEIYFVRLFGKMKDV